MDLQEKRKPKTKRIARRDGPLLRQFKSWAKGLMRVNPDYVQDPKRLRDYVRGPNWDAPFPDYAHYRSTIEFHGAELLGLFERLRADGNAGIEEYRQLLAEAGIEEAK